MNFILNDLSSPSPRKCFFRLWPLSFRSQLRFPQGFVRAAPALIAAVLSVTGQGWIAPGQTQSKQGRANLVLEPTHCEKECKRNKGNWRKSVFVLYPPMASMVRVDIDPSGCRSRSWCCQTICSISHGSNTALFIAPRMTQQSGETESLPLFINFMAVVVSSGGQR